MRTLETGSPGDMRTVGAGSPDKTSRGGQKVLSDVDDRKTACCGCLELIVREGGVLLVGDWRPDGAPVLSISLSVSPPHSVSPSLSPLNY